MMKNSIRIDFENGQLIMDRTFAKKATIPTSEEYKELQRVRKDYPLYRVVRRKIRTNPQKETYAGLTYHYMENYISSHETAENLDAVMAEYQELRLIAQCHGKGRRYPTIKKWFLKKYPAVAEFGVEKKVKDLPATDTNSGYELLLPPLSDANLKTDSSKSAA